MNLNYVESFITNILDQNEIVIKNQLRKLISSIQDYIKKEDEFESGLALTTLDEYYTFYLKLLDDFSILSESDIDKKADKAHEVLCVISSINSYIIVVTHKVDKVGYFKDRTKVMDQLRDKREHFKSEKFVWMSIVKDLTSLRALKIAEINQKIYDAKEQKC